MTNYKGNKPCHCCGRPGSERSRSAADQICYDCYSVWQLGLATKAEQAKKETHVMFRAFPFYVEDVNECDKFFEILKILVASISDTTAKHEAYVTCGSHSYRKAEGIITKMQAEALASLHKQIATSFKVVYSKGKQEGQDLLSQLNNGSITLAKFDSETAKQNKY